MPKLTKNTLIVQMSKICKTAKNGQNVSIYAQFFQKILQNVQKLDYKYQKVFPSHGTCRHSAVILASRRLRNPSTYYIRFSLWPSKEGKVFVHGLWCMASIPSKLTLFSCSFSSTLEAFSMENLSTLRSCTLTLSLDVQKTD